MEYIFKIHYVARNPPSIGRATPFIIELRSLSKNTIASTTSPTSAKNKTKIKLSFLSFVFIHNYKAYIVLRVFVQM